MYPFGTGLNTHIMYHVCYGNNVLRPGFEYRTLQSITLYTLQSTGTYTTTTTTIAYS